MQVNRQRNPVTRVCGAFVRLVVALTAMVAALYLMLLASTVLLRNKWASEKIRAFSTLADRRVRRIAGTRWGALYFNMSALKHVGRSSGHEYVTPLSAYPFGDGFVLALAYGPDTDWYRNILAAGKCALKWMGREYALERPEIIPISQAMRAYPLLVRPFIIVPGTKLFVWLHRQQEAPAPVPGKGMAQTAAQ